MATLGSVLCAGRCHSKCLWAEWESEGSHNQHNGALYPGPQTYRAHANSLLISSEESPGHSAEGEVFAEQVPTSTEARVHANTHTHTRKEHTETHLHSDTAMLSSLQPRRGMSRGPAWSILRRNVLGPPVRTPPLPGYEPVAAAQWCVWAEGGVCVVESERTGNCLEIP